MNIDDKIDRILEDVATIKVVTRQHTNDIAELKKELKPVFFHVTGMQWAMKMIIAIVTIGSLVVGIVAMTK